MDKYEMFKLNKIIKDMTAFDSTFAWKVIPKKNNPKDSTYTIVNVFYFYYGRSKKLSDYGRRKVEYWRNALEANRLSKTGVIAKEQESLAEMYAQLDVEREWTYIKVEFTTPQLEFYEKTYGKIPVNRRLMRSLDREIPLSEVLE